MPFDLGDPLFTSWLLAWGGEGLRHPLQLFNAPMFYPDPLTLMFSENLLGIAVPLAPVWYATKNAVLLNNLALMGSISFNAFGTYLFARKLRISWLGSVVAGSIFAFAPYRIAQLSHLHVEATFWIPLLLLVLVSHIEMPTLWKGLLIGGLLAGQVWSSLNGAVIGAVALVIGAGAGLIYVIRRCTWQRFALGLAVGGLLVLVATYPLFYFFQEARRLYEINMTIEEATRHSADLTSFVLVPQHHLLLGKATKSLRVGAQIEKTLYPGVVALILAFVGVMRFRTRRLLLGTLGIGAIVPVVFTFGPEAHGVKLPFGYVLDVLPFLTNLRVPTRLWPLFLLALGLLAGGAFPMKKWLAAIAVAALFVDYFSFPLPTSRVPDVDAEYRWLARQKGSVIEIPGIDPEHPGAPSLYNETKALFRQTRHWNPMLNGYSSYLPHDYLSAMTAIRSFPDSSSLDILAERKIRWAVIHLDEIENTPWQDVALRIGEMRVVVRTPELLIVKLPT